jgi:hypothetical protein
VLSIPHLGQGLTPQSCRATPLSSSATEISAPTSRTAVQPPSATSPPPRVVGEPEPPQPCLAHPPTSTVAPPLDLVVPHCLSRRPRPCRHRAPGAVTAQGRAVPAWAIQAVSAAGPGRTREASGRKPTQRCVSCFRFFIFVYNSRKSYRVLKYVENTTLLEKI